jgi:hypothetical protein
MKETREGLVMKEWEERFLDAAQRGLEKEQRELTNLCEGRHRDCHCLASGIRDLYEPQLVYVMYKGLLAEGHFKDWTILWEDRYVKPDGSKSKKKCDIVMSPSPKPTAAGPWYYIEVGGFSHPKLAKELKKLRQPQHPKTKIAGRYILTYEWRLLTAPKLEVVLQKDERVRDGSLRMVGTRQITIQLCEDKKPCVKGELEIALMSVK